MPFHGVLSSYRKCLSPPSWTGVRKFKAFLMKSKDLPFPAETVKYSSPACHECMRHRNATSQRTKVDVACHRLEGTGGVRHLPCREEMEYRHQCPLELAFKNGRKKRWRAGGELSLAGASACLAPTIFATSSNWR